MRWFEVGDRHFSSGRAGARMLQAGVLVLMLAFALPGRAGDARGVKSRVTPVYPEIARRMKICGLVKVEATVDAQGKVTEVKEVSGNHMLAVAAADAVKQWRFLPGPADTNENVEINFTASQ
jgi:TonB family protein